MYFASTVAIIVSEDSAELHFGNATLIAAAREAIRKDWARVNMQTRLHADPIINDEVSFTMEWPRMAHFVARCTAENTITIMTLDESIA